VSANTASSSAGAQPQPGAWRRIARRIRVPLGFAFAVVYFWLAQPSAVSLAIGAAIAVAGLALRAAASGHVRKNAELTTSGPYAYTRNPLYLGSVIIAAGFAVAARSWWIAGLLAVMFAAIYWPVILGEEEFLRSQFAEFDDYARRVPRLLPRLRASAPRVSAENRGANVGHHEGGPNMGHPEIGAGGGFSRELYVKHREYNALIGAAAMLAALAAKMIWIR